MNPADFLATGYFIDSASPAVVEFTQRTTAELRTVREKVIALYRVIRDGIAYDPYVDFSDRESFRASSVLSAGRGFCVGKSALFAATARAAKIPARVGYADVRNHLTSPRIYQHIKTDIFIWHSYSDLFICGRWVKATPAFDLALCDRLGLQPRSHPQRRLSAMQNCGP